MNIPSSAPPTARSTARSAGLSATSQALSSATNFGLLAVLTVLARPAELGGLVAVGSVYLLALTLTRALVTDALVAAGGTGAPPWRWARRVVTRLGLAATLVGLALGTQLGIEPVALILLVVPIPLLLVQDGQRHLAWCLDRPAVAPVLDGVWLIVSVTAGLLLASVGPGVGATSVIGAWTLGGMASWAVGRAVIERRAFATGPSLSEAATNASLRISPAGRGRYVGLAVGQAMYAVAFNLLPVVMAVLFQPTMAATLKALLLPFGPILSLVAGFRVVTLPLIRRAVDRGAAAGGDTDGWTLRLVAIGAVATAAVSVAVAGVTRALPAGWVGPSLDAVRPLLWWGAALTVMFVVAQLLADVRALSRPPRIVIARRAAAIGLEWMGLLAGTALAGTHGLAVGWTIGLALATMAWLAPMTPDPTVSVRAATAP